jgi:branched-chain amino acid aminotransferase
MSYKHFSKNGLVLPIEKATISVSNLEYAYGFGVYELIKVRSSIPYFIEQHVKRLLKSAEIVGIDHEFHFEQIEQYINELLEYEKIDSCNIKILLVGGKTQKDVELFILLLAPLFPDRKYYTEGVRTITFPFERPFPKAKSLSMIGSYIAYKKAKEKKCYDALSIQDGNIVEGTRTNFFTIKDKMIFTQEDDIILNGVTREIVLFLARKNGYHIQTEKIHKNNLSHYDSAFLTSTSSKIIPVKEIDDYTYMEIPKNLKALMNIYDEFLKDSKGFFNP